MNEFKYLKDAQCVRFDDGVGAEVVRTVDKIAVINEWKLGKNTIPGTVIFRTPGLKISA